MATLDDVRSIATALPGVVEKPFGQRGGIGWRTTAGLVVWERGPSKTDLVALEQLGRQWPGGVVVGVRTDGLETKEALLQSYPDAFFTIPHFDGYTAVLVQLDRIERDHLAEVITDAWLLRAPRRTAAAWLAEHGDPEA